MFMPGAFLIQCNPFVIMVLTPHVTLFVWPSRHNERDIELKFCIFSKLPYPLLAAKFDKCGYKDKISFIFLQYKDHVNK